MSIQWFARGGGIAKCGPYPSQLRAVDAMRLAGDKRDVFPPDIFVWPEEVADEADAKEARPTAVWAGGIDECPPAARKART